MEIDIEIYRYAPICSKDEKPLFSLLTDLGYDLSLAYGSFILIVYSTSGSSLWGQVSLHNLGLLRKTVTLVESASRTSICFLVPS